VEALFNREKALHARVLKAVKGEGAAMAADQDALADESRVVRQALADGAQNASIGDVAFRAVLTKAAALMGETKIYEQMIGSAERIEGESFSEATTLCKQVLVDLARVLELLNTSQRSTAGDKAESMKEAASDIREKLDALVEQQRAVVEKSKELASKDEFSKEDVAQAKELAAKKEEIAKLIEQMLTDAHALPDLRPMNELREELTKIYEDVIQQDAEKAAAGELKPSEIAVQKEESLLEALEKAAKTAEDMEMWLPDKNETTKWLMENFDLTEMP
jgi:type I site-specific restriction endonuclease